MKTPFRTVLLVDDDTNILRVLEARFTSAGYYVLQANSGKHALETIKQKGVDIIISDVKMPTMSGIEFYSNLQEIARGIPIIFLTAYGTIPEAVYAIQAGAVDYLAKPFDGKKLVEKVDDYFGDHPTEIRSTPQQFDDTDLYWGESLRMQNLKETVSRVAACKANTLILGESGVGKEGMALCIHKNSTTASGPYIVVDCGSTPSGILESELFGHTKGAFTNALHDKKGLIEAAHGGTLFLDEIGNISMEMQHRLLRFLEDKKIRRVGSVEEKQIDCRVIAATNADLKADIETGKFRQDLYYRLRVVTLDIPPLRERKDEIAILARIFVDHHCREHGLNPVKISDKTDHFLISHDWPGNIRELKNALEAAVILCKNNTIEPSDLQLEPTYLNQSGNNQKRDQFSLENNEKEAIIKALKKTDGVLTKAADLLDISRRSIHYKLKKYQIQAAEFRR